MSGRGPARMRATPGQPRHALALGCRGARPDYITSTEDERDFLDEERRFFCPGLLTEIFAPLGIGKSMVMTCFAVRLAAKGYRGLLINRDNPKRVVKTMLRAFGAAETPRLKIIGREKAPPLTDRAGWRRFPYADYDYLIVDSLDSSTEGVGEQDSAKPSLAIAALLDVVHRDQGPAAVVIGNTKKDAKSGRSSGVMGDRADIIYEVRDVTGFVPSGKAHWLEELPPASRDEWAAQNRRRAKRARYRLAFVCTGSSAAGRCPSRSSWRSGTTPTPGRWWTSPPRCSRPASRPRPPPSRRSRRSRTRPWRPSFKPSGRLP